MIYSDTRDRRAARHLSGINLCLRSLGLQQNWRKSRCWSEKTRRGGVGSVVLLGSGTAERGSRTCTICRPRRSRLRAGSAASVGQDGVWWTAAGIISGRLITPPQRPSHVVRRSARRASPLLSTMDCIARRRFQTVVAVFVVTVVFVVDLQLGGKCCTV